MEHLNQLDSGLTKKHYFKLEMFAIDKQTSLFIPLVRNEEKRLITLTRGANVIKPFKAAIYVSDK
jgi:hypothetical protein